MISNFLFDLDGTLTDPAEGITNSIRYALHKFGIEETDYAKLCACIGPPLADSFPRYWNIPASQTAQAVEWFREYFRAGGMFENTVYPGIPEMLSELSEKGASLYVATSKPERFAREILEHFGLYGYFKDIIGNNMEETRSEKDKVISYLMSLHPDVTPSDTLMVGDRKYDVEGAAKCGIPCAAVLFGYGSEEELSDSGALYLPRTVRELHDLLVSLMESGKKE